VYGGVHGRRSWALTSGSSMTEEHTLVLDFDQEGVLRRETSGYSETGGGTGKWFSDNGPDISLAVKRATALAWLHAGGTNRSQTRSNWPHPELSYGRRSA
jgi:hypothetical protein